MAEDWERMCAEMKKMRRSRLLAVCGTISVLALLSTGTFAYFTTQAEVENSITTGTVRVEVHQYDDAGAEISGDSKEPGVLPGATVEYSAAVENTGSEPIYLRVRLAPKVVKEGRNAGLKAGDATDCLEPAINTDAWTKEGEYYYYHSILEPGAQTEPLFTSVHFNGPNMDNAYLGSELALNVEAYGIQSDNMNVVTVDDGGSAADMATSIPWSDVPADTSLQP